MEARMTVEDYFTLPESNRPMELLDGVVHEPPAPNCDHQYVVTQLTTLLNNHVQRHRLGQVCVSPVDVVLDRVSGLVLQPDVIFVCAAREHIVSDRVWGPPDLAIEVLSFGTAARDRTLKMDCYRRYGVRECWLVEPVSRVVEVFSFAEPTSPPPRTFGAGTRVRSGVLPRLRLPVDALFRT